MIAVKSGRNTSHLLIKLECMVTTATDLTAIIAECALQYAPPAPPLVIRIWHQHAPVMSLKQHQHLLLQCLPRLLQLFCIVLQNR